MSRDWGGLLHQDEGDGRSPVRGPAGYLSLQTAIVTRSLLGGVRPRQWASTKALTVSNCVLWSGLSP